MKHTYRRGGRRHRRRPEPCTIQVKCRHRLCAPIDHNRHTVTLVTTEAKNEEKKTHKSSFFRIP